LTMNFLQQVLELSGIDHTKDFALALPVINVEQMEKPVELSQKTIAEFIGLKFGLTFMLLKNPSCFSPSGSHEKGSGEEESLSEKGPEGLKPSLLC
jgi:hypothetical protein